MDIDGIEDAPEAHVTHYREKSLELETKVAELERTLTDKNKIVDNLAMLISRLVRKCPQNDDLAARAMDYLARNGLFGSPLRARTGEIAVTDWRDDVIDDLGRLVRTLEVRCGTAEMKCGALRERLSTSEEAIEVLHAKTKGGALRENLANAEEATKDITTENLINAFYLAHKWHLAQIEPPDCQYPSGEQTNVSIAYHFAKAKAFRALCVELVTKDMRYEDRLRLCTAEETIEVLHQKIKGGPK